MFLQVAVLSKHIPCHVILIAVNQTSEARRVYPTGHSRNSVPFIGSTLSRRYFSQTTQFSHIHLVTQHDNETPRLGRWQRRHDATCVCEIKEA